MNHKRSLGYTPEEKYRPISLEIDGLQSGGIAYLENVACGPSKGITKLRPLLEHYERGMSSSTSVRSMGPHKATLILTLYERVSSMDRIGMSLLRIGLVVVIVWIGGLKFADYEADSIVPMVANSPLMSFAYSHPVPEYRAYINKEGEVVQAHHEWQLSNRTYTFSHLLGSIIVLIGVAIALHWRFPQIAAVGSWILILMACTTLSFLITTPEAWVPPLGSATHGFPYLSGVGRLIVKDFIMLGAAVVTMADSAKQYLEHIKER